jgi:hypothetical protein
MNDFTHPTSPAEETPSKVEEVDIRRAIVTQSDRLTQRLHHKPRRL